MRKRLRRLLNLDDSPHKISQSFSIGIFIAFTPFYGLQTVLAIVIATVLRLNKAAVVIGSVLNFPWFAPLIFFACYFLGAFLWGVAPFTNELELFSWSEFTGYFVSWSAFKAFFEPETFLRVFMPTLLGTTVVGLIAAIASYYLVRDWLVDRRSPKTTVAGLQKASIIANLFTSE